MAEDYSLTAAEAVTRIAALMDWGDTPTAAQTAKARAAMTHAGMTACKWKGRDWSWLQGTGSFSTVASTASYNLQTEVGEALEGVARVHYDDERRITPISWKMYREWYDLVRPDGDNGAPEYYSMTDDATLYLQPVPDAVYTINVLYTKRHVEIDSDADTLLVPAAWRYPVYVLAPVWILRQDSPSGALSDCPAFVEAMRSMRDNEPMVRDREAVWDYPDFMPLPSGSLSLTTGDNRFFEVMS